MKKELEKENFKVDSADWEKLTNPQGTITYLENPEKDIWEYVDGVPSWLVGQQLFTWSAAMRETAKVGKRMPTDEEFSQFEKKEDFGRIIYSGYLNINGAFYRLSSSASFWSSSVSGTNAWRRDLNSSHSTVYRGTDDQAFGFAVRCLA